MSELKSQGVVKVIYPINAQGKIQDFSVSDFFSVNDNYGGAKGFVLTLMLLVAYLANTK